MAATRTSFHVHHLRQDELEYELRFRGLAASTVQTMRASLGSLVRLEREGNAPPYPKYTFDPAVDVVAITAKYGELEALVTAVTSGGTSGDRDRCCSRLLHLLGRVGSIPIGVATEAVTVQRADWMGKISALLTTLRRCKLGEPNLSTSLLELGSSDDNESDDGAASVLNRSLPVTVATDRRVPVYKWGVRFTGDPKDMSVMDFLERIEELRRARGCTESELYHSSLDLFQGKALIWYRSAIGKCKTWPELAELLKHHYLPPDYRSRLFQEILNRTQGPDEPIVEYLSCMQALVLRYGQISKEVQLDIVRRNLAPYYTLQLPPVQTLEELERECLVIETKKYRAEHYRAPPRRTQSCVEPDLACVASGLGVLEMTEPAKRPPAGPPHSAATLRCHLCGRLGHIRRFCPRLRDETSGNSRRGDRAGNGRSPQ